MLVRMEYSCSLVHHKTLLLHPTDARMAISVSNSSCSVPQAVSIIKSRITSNKVVTQSHPAHFHPSIWGDHFLTYSSDVKVPIITRKIIGQVFLQKYFVFIYRFPKISYNFMCFQSTRTSRVKNTKKRSSEVTKKSLSLCFFFLTSPDFSDQIKTSKFLLYFLSLSFRKSKI